MSASGHDSPSSVAVRAAGSGKSATWPQVALGTRIRRLVLLVLAASAAYVGVWALLAPASFYRAFPGGGQAWARTDGLYNEHLVRDVGALHLALLAVTCAALLRPETDRARVAGVAWLLFGVPHLAYHAEHLSMTHAAVMTSAAQLSALGWTVVLAALLCLPARTIR